MPRRFLVHALAAGVVATALPAGASAAPLELVSVTHDGRQSPGRSSEAALSRDGRFVAFTSEAHLAPGVDSDGVFVRDRVTGTTELVSVTSDGAPSDGYGHYGLAITPDARFVAFTSDARNLDDRDRDDRDDVFLHDRGTGRTELVSLGHDDDLPGAMAWSPAISDDGRYVGYGAAVQKPDTSVQFGVFLRDRQTGVTERVSVGRDGALEHGRPPAVSADGRFVAFPSEAALVAGDTNGTSDVYVRDRRTATTTRVSEDGESYAAAISADGNIVAFTSSRDDRADVFLHDRRTGVTERITESNGHTYLGDISADGRQVAFSSESSTLVPWDTNDDTDVFVHDRETNETTRVSLNRTGMQANRTSHGPAISPDGGVVAFNSYAFNLVDRDTNNQQDVFLADLRAADPVAPAPPCPGADYAGAVACDRPAAHWRFEEPTRSPLAFDAMGAAPVSPLYDYPTRAPGAVGGGVALNLAGRATGDQFYAGDLFDFLGRAPFTLETWVKPLDLPEQTGRVFSKEDNGQAGYLLGVNASGVVFSRYVLGRADTVSAPVPARRWSHIAAVYDGHGLTLYVNGRAVATRPSAVALPNVRESLFIGSKLAQWRRFAGWLDEAAVYPRALPAQAIARHWAAAG